MSTPEPLSWTDALRAYRNEGGVIFPTLGVGVQHGQVSALTRLRDMRRVAPLGPLAGARAEVIAELPWFGKSHPVPVVRFADGTSHTGAELVGGYVRRAREQAAEFNTLARAATPSPTAPAPPPSRVECVYCGTMNSADLDRCDHCGAPIRTRR